MRHRVSRRVWARRGWRVEVGGGGVEVGDDGGSSFVIRGAHLPRIFVTAWTRSSHDQLAEEPTRVGYSFPCVIFLLVRQGALGGFILEETPVFRCSVPCIFFSCRCCFLLFLAGQSRALNSAILHGFKQYAFRHGRELELELELELENFILQGL